VFWVLLERAVHVVLEVLLVLCAHPDFGALLERVVRVALVVHGVLLVV